MQPAVADRMYSFETRDNSGFDAENTTGGPGAAAKSFPTLGVVIPAYNEAKTIDLIISRVLAQKCVCELIVVDDGSVDGTAELVKGRAQKDPRVRAAFHVTNRGKGAAVRTGLQLSVAPILIIQDADLEYDPEDYDRLIEPILSRTADVVFGSRFLPNAKIVNPFWHTLGNKMLTFLSNMATNLALTDEATCYKVFRREILERITLKEDGFGFCPEFTAKVARLKAPICEVPVRYQGRTRKQGKKIRLRDGLGALRCIIQYNFFSSL